MFKNIGRLILPAYHCVACRIEIQTMYFVFGNSQEIADQLADLVLRGFKTATCSRFSDYKTERVPFPKESNLSVLVDGSGTPVTVLETLAVFVVPFDEVPDWFAWAEGEGDRSLSYWQNVHRTFFGEHYPNDQAFSEDLPLICEQFRVVHNSQMLWPRR
jgi:uncharacterized protein YhfF